MIRYDCTELFFVTYLGIYLVSKYVSITVVNCFLFFPLRFLIFFS